MKNREVRERKKKRKDGAKSGEGKREGKKKDAFKKENGCEANQRQMN